jgi:hypothetical protein
VGRKFAATLYFPHPEPIFRPNLERM